MTIANLAEIKNCVFETDDISIEDGAKLSNVHIKASKAIIKSGAVMIITGSKWGISYII